MKQLQTKRTNIVKIKNFKYTFSITMLVFCAAGLALGGCNNNKKEDDEKGVVKEDDKKDEDLSTNDTPNIVIPDDLDDEKLINGNEEDNKKDDSNVSVNNKNKNNGKHNNTTSNNSNKDNSGTQINNDPVKDPQIASCWSKLESTAKAGQNYYSEYYTKTRIISKNGYLYNFAASNQITPDYLVREGRLADSNTSDDISIMLMYGTDITYFGGTNVKITNSDKEFTVFAFMKHPSENTYVFASDGGSYGTLSANAYNLLMSRYSMNHGTIRRITPSNVEYDRILSCIRMFESRYESYFVRSITVDDKYAFVVLSGRANAATIREYILKYENGIWEVVMDDLETEGRLPIVVNKKLPDFNMSMIPTYNIKDYTMLTDYTEVMDELTRAGLYAKNDTFYYFCGTKDYCYMITDSGKRFLCRKINDKWECYKVTDYYDALNKLQRFTDNPPAFILLDLE